MDNQLSRGQLIAQGEEASRLLDGEVMGKAFEGTRAEFIRCWEMAESTAAREKFHARVVGLSEVQRHLRRMISQGEHASRQPDER